MGGLIGVKVMTLKDFTGSMVLRASTNTCRAGTTAVRAAGSASPARGLSFAGPRPPCSALVLRAQKLTLVRTQTSMLPALSIE